jgi:enhancing lycopene biosynthesis protein 2
MSKRVAVVLAGCGFLDGAEIRESVLTLLNLDIYNAQVSIFAPDKEQHHVINHKAKNEASEKRNVLVEAARIARCQVEPLSKLRASHFDCLVLPGGFGVAKNLCTFAFEGAKGSVDPEVKAVIEDFNNNNKAIGAICISPALIAMVLGKKGVTVTIGKDIETAQEVEKTGAKHINCEVTDCVVDKANKVATTPAYMFDAAKLDDINTGIRKCISATLSL